MNREQVRDKYAHATRWDFETDTPQARRLRETLAAEYDAAHPHATGTDPVRERYIHAVRWDYEGDDERTRRLRAMLAREYDHARDLRMPLGEDDFMPCMRRIVRRILERMEADRLTASADSMYSALFPFPDRPSIGDAIVLDAVAAELGGVR